MACPNGVKWCAGPVGFGAKCQKCQTAASAAPKPGALPLPTPKVQLPPLKVGPPTLKVGPPSPQTGLPTPPIILPTQPAQPPKVTAGAGEVIVYRGDTREPGVIKRDGFQLWGAAIANVSKARGIGNYLREACAKYKNGKTLADWVRATKDQNRPTVSTSKNDGCGGYDRGYIYKIVYPGLSGYEFDEKVLPPGAALSWRSDGLTIYMDQSSTQHAKSIVVDLKLGTEEWAFFTTVPPERIAAYLPAEQLKDYRDGKAAFQSMDAVQKITKKLW